MLFLDLNLNKCVCFGMAHQAPAGSKNELVIQEVIQDLSIPFLFPHNVSSFVQISSYITAISLS